MGKYSLHTYHFLSQMYSVMLPHPLFLSVLSLSVFSSQVFILSKDGFYAQSERKRQPLLALALCKIEEDAAMPHTHQPFWTRGLNKVDRYVRFEPESQAIRCPIWLSCVLNFNHIMTASWENLWTHWYHSKDTHGVWLFWWHQLSKLICWETYLR